VVETNTHLRDVAQAEFKKIEYRSLEGQELKGWVMLPVGYQPGERYPLITVVYGGLTFGDNPPGMTRTINHASSLNYQLLAAHGYAVLFPSMPLKAEGEPSDPYQELTKGVLPAVDTVIELGIADPTRLGVLGQSYGGYSAYGLIAQTRRFHAAVSLAGLSDLASLYGVFDARFRYDQFAHERLFSMSLAESGQVRMGSPPWKDSARYIRNSPLFYADQIDTPLMIVQGDLDMVAMQQGEQVFTALYRQNKRAAFVRYWGEGHVIEGAANIRDLWERIYGWFDQFLRPMSSVRSH
jgi:dipeptidyl aminopeptidase/acylaminoacyl peptidase